MNQTESITDLAAALSKAQAQIEHAKADATGLATSTRSYSYATLASVWAAVRDPLTKNGLSVIQLPMDGPSPDTVSVVTRLMHSTGQYIESKLTMRPAQQTPQAFGSCITYMRRYALAAITGIAPADDDGHEASQKPTVQQGAQRQPPSQQQKANQEELRSAVKHEMLDLITKIGKLRQDHGMDDDEVEAATGHRTLKGLTLEQYREIYAALAGHCLNKEMQQSIGEPPAETVDYTSESFDQTESLSS